MIRNATARAIQSAGMAMDGEWFLAVGPTPYRDIGLHAASSVIAEAGGSGVFSDSAARDRISLQILEAGQIIDSMDIDTLHTRTSVLSMSFLITDSRGRIRFSEVLRESMLDTIPSAGTELAGRPMGKREDSFWERLLIPFAIVGAAGVAVFLLFHVRS